MPTKPKRHTAVSCRPPLTIACGRPAAARASLVTLVVLLVAMASPSRADGLRWPGAAARWQSEPAERWSPWQGRIGLTLGDAASTTVAPHAAGTQGSGLRLQGMRLLGDYYFSPRSGFHATGGLLSGPLSASWSPAPAPGGLSLTLHSPRWASGLGTEPSTPRPYLGAGYSLGSDDGRWSFSADIGLIGRPGDGLARWSPEAVGWTSLGDRLGRWQVQPLVQLGVSYSF